MTAYVRRVAIALAIACTVSIACTVASAPVFAQGAAARPVPQPVQTALPPHGVLPTGNPLTGTPVVTGMAPKDAIVTRVLHFMAHLLGGPKPQPMPSPFHDSCGVRPCPYDLRY